MAVGTDHLVRLRGRGAAMSPAARVYVLCALGVAALWPSFTGLARLWRDTMDYGHGYLIAAVSIIWLLLLRRQIDATPVRPELPALPVLLVATATWLIAYRANSEIIHQLIAPAIILLAVLAATGWQVMRRIFGPVAYLYFAVPIWDQLLPVLQFLTIRVSEAVLRLLQIPAVVESYMVTIPEGRFAILEGCSGRRYFLVALAFATLVGFKYQLRAMRIALLVAAAAGMALVANWVRVIVIIYAGHVSNMEHYLVAKEHGTLGWLLYVPLLLGVVLGAARVARRPAPAHQESNGRESSASPARSAAWLAAAACLCVPLLAVAIGPIGADRVPQLGRLPLMVSEWQGPLPAAESWDPEFASPADERRAAYVSAAGDVQMYVNVFGVQSQGHELIFFSNTVLPHERWTILERLPKRDGMMITFAKDSADSRWVVAQTYVVGGRLISVPVLAQLYYGVLALWRPVPSGTVAFAAACRPDCAAATERIHRFWSDHGQVVLGLIPASL